MIKISKQNMHFDEMVSRNKGLPNSIKKLAEKGALPNTYRKLNIETVNGESTIKIFYIDKLLIYKGVNLNIYNNVLIGEGSSNLYVDGYCDLLLHYTLK